MSRYLVVPKSANDVIVVATSAALKTLLQVATPSTTDIRVVAWGIGFKGVSPTAVPGEGTLIDVDVAATVTTLTPEKWDSAFQQASLCVGGASATGYNASGEGTITDSRILDPAVIHPQTGYSIWFPGRGPRISASRFLRIRVEFAADVNAVPWIIFDEAA